MAGPWEKYGQASAQASPWEKYGSAAPQATPNAGLAPPASPQLPVPLQQPQGQGGMSSGQQVLGAAREGTLSDLMAQDTSRVASVAPAAIGGGMIGPTGRLMQAMSRPLGFLERRLPALARTDISGGLNEVGGLLQKAAPKEYVPPEVPLTQQMGYKYPVPKGGMRGTPLGPKPSVGQPLAQAAQPSENAAQGAIAQARTAARQELPKRVAAMEATGREPLIKQMGGRPVEDITDQALKQQMEGSREVSYSKYAKHHQGPSSKAYPEPEQWQDQPPDLAPWGGRFFRK